MMNAREFKELAQQWICDGYTLDVRYIAKEFGGNIHLLYGAVTFGPVPRTDSPDINFSLKLGPYRVGQEVTNFVTKEELDVAFARSLDGHLVAHEMRMRLPNNEDHRRRFEPSVAVGWENQLTGTVISPLFQSDLFSDLRDIDEALRIADVPFDGVDDLLGWLDIRANLDEAKDASVSLSVISPVDIDLHKTVLSGGTLIVHTMSHPALNLDSVGLAVRATPDQGIAFRKQIANQIEWRQPQQGVRDGKATVPFNGAHSALLILNLGKRNVRRHWFVDPDASRNERLVVMRKFDEDLKQLKAAMSLTKERESTKFELGVGSLLFLLGFNLSHPVENEAPDLIVFTPGGQIAIVECTIKIGDVGAKVGKLVNRREHLARMMASDRPGATVLALLACGAPRNGIASTDTDLAKHGVLLLAREELERALLGFQNPVDPDSIYAEAISRIDQLRSSGKSAIGIAPFNLPVVGG